MIDLTIEKLEAEKNNTKFSYLLRVCHEYFGKPRIKGSHHIFRTPWQGDPRINIQMHKGKAKPYQVEQIISALIKLKAEQKDES